MNPELLARVGQSLYGGEWRVRLASDLNVSERTLRRWALGEQPIPDGVLSDLIALCETRGERLQTLASTLKGAKP